MRLAAAALLAIGCSGDSPMGPPVETVDGARVEVRVDDRADRLAIDLAITNETADTITVLFPGTCNPSIVLLDGRGDPVWDELAWKQENSACLPVIRGGQLGPASETGTYHEVADQQVLGDSLPAGTYTVLVQFTMEQPEAILTFDAGSVRIGQ